MATNTINDTRANFCKVVSLLLICTVSAFLLSSCQSSDDGSASLAAPPTPNSATRPTATPTSEPMPTSPPLSASEQLDLVQREAASNCAYLPTDGVVANYDPNSGKATIITTENIPMDIQGVQSLVHYMVYSCFYNFLNPNFIDYDTPFVKDVYIEIHGPLLDIYGNTTVVLCGYAELNSATAQAINWDSEDSDAVWNSNIYDKQWQRS